MENRSKIDESEESVSDHSFLIGCFKYIKNGTIEKKKQKNDQEVPIKRDTGASMLSIFLKTGQKFFELKLEETALGIETYDHDKMQYLSALFREVLR